MASERRTSRKPWELAIGCVLPCVGKCVLCGCSQFWRFLSEDACSNHCYHCHLLSFSVLYDLGFAQREGLVCFFGVERNQILGGLNSMSE